MAETLLALIWFIKVILFLYGSLFARQTCQHFLYHLILTWTGSGSHVNASLLTWASPCSRERLPAHVSAFLLTWAQVNTLWYHRCSEKRRVTFPLTATQRTWWYPISYLQYFIKQSTDYYKTCRSNFFHIQLISIVNRNHCYSIVSYRYNCTLLYTECAGNWYKYCTLYWVCWQLI